MCRSRSTSRMSTIGPCFPNETAIREIAENSAAGSPAGDPVTAVDQDGDTLTYSLTGGDATLFRIDTETGQITVSANADLNFEVQNNTRVDSDLRQTPKVKLISSR